MSSSSDSSSSETPEHIVPEGHDAQKACLDKTGSDKRSTPKVWHEERPRKPGPPNRDFIPIFDPPRAPRWRSWLLIALSALALMAVTAIFQRHDATLQQKAEADNVSIQARQAASLMEVEGEYAVLHHIRSLATTPSATRRVAVTWAALDRGDGTRVLIALSLMTRIPTQVAAGDPLGAPERLDPLLRHAFMYPLEIDPKDRRFIESEVGWPARLLFVRDLPPHSEEKLSLYSQANSISTWSAIVVVLALLAGALGLLLLACFWMSVRRDEVQFKLSKAHSTCDVYLEAAAVYLACFALGRGLSLVPGRATWVLSILLQIGGSILGIFWPALRGVPLRAMGRDLGVHLGDGFWTEVRAGLVGYCAVLPFFAAGVLCMMALQWALGVLGVPVHSPVHPDLVGLGRMSVEQRMVTLLLTAVFAPITEELMFRGALFRGMRERWSFWPSAWACALIFAAIHPQGVLVIPPLAALALGFAGLREWRDSLISPVIAHAMHNATLVILLSILLR